MNKKIDIGQDAKVVIKWNTQLGVPTEELEKRIIALMAKKYEIPQKHIKIEKNYITSESADGTLAGDLVQNANDPKFQQELMKIWIKNNDIKDVDFDEIVKIDSQINALIDYDSYEKGKKYTIKWVRWGNFLSYGPDNFFDFTNLHGLVLLNGEPANKSGKTTFAYDLLHFLLFGKTNPDKAKTLGAIFNNYLPDCNNVNVEGCISIDGDDYIIRRTVTRSKGKKTITNKVDYFKVMPDGTEELLKDENQQGATTTATTKLIKEAIGNENDFDLIISANSKDLDELISLTETQKSRLLSRWIGLSVIEDKDIKAREKWNKEISIGRFSDMYNKVQLETEIEELTNLTKSYNEEIDKANKGIAESDSKIEGFSKTRDTLLSSKQEIDESLLKVDAVTLKNSIDDLIVTGKQKAQELKVLNEEIKQYGDIEYSDEEYKSLRKRNEELISSMAEARANIKSLKLQNEALANAEYCPTCHRKLDNVDNSEQIKKNNDEVASIIDNGKKMKAESDNLSAKIKEIDDKIVLSQQKAKKELKAATLTASIATQRVTYKEKVQLLNEIQKNKDAIIKNNQIDASLNIIHVNIRTEENIKDNLSKSILSYSKEITKAQESIALRKGYLVKIDEERKTEQYWKLYMKMIGKDGISKMVLRNALPIINSQLDNILQDATDFTVRVVMSDNNDIDFHLIRDGVTTRLSAASGLEKTQSALALRVVLGQMSKLSRPPFLFLDEILGTVDREFYDDMRKLYDKISSYYDFILHISHLSEIVDWHDSVITVQKIDNISRIK